MDFKILTKTSEFRDLENDWKIIEKTSNYTTFFSTFDYCYSWWKSYQNHPSYKLFIICVYHNKNLIAIAPLMLFKQEKILQTSTVLKFLSRADYHNFLINNTINITTDKIYKKIFLIIEENNSLWDEILLTHFHYKDPISNYIFKSKFNNHLNYLIENPFINTTKFDDYNDFYNRCVPSKAKQYANRLKKKINYSLIITNDNLINEFSKIHIAEKEFLNKKGLRHRHSLFENVENKNFIKLMSDKGHVLSYYLVDDSHNIMIYNAGYVFENIYYSVLTAYDPKYANLGLGRVIYLEIFKENFLHPRWNVLDSGTGRYSWKFEWTSDFNILYQLQIEKPHNNFMKKMIRKIIKIKKILFSK